MSERPSRRLGPRSPGTPSFGKSQTAGQHLLKLRTRKSETSAIAGAALAAVLIVAALPAQAQAQRAAEAAVRPFDTMEGAWAGTGSVTLGSGDKERIRCRVTYDVDGGGLQVVQDLRCASDSYKFEMLSEIIFSNGQVKGHWTEKTQRTNGTISGRARAGEIEALAEAGGFSAFFTMITRGDRQSVKIESQSPQISDVTITLRRLRK